MFDRLVAADVSLAQVISWAPAILYVYDTHESRSIFQNRPLTELLGYGPDAAATLADGKWRTLVHPADQARFPAHRARLASLAPGEASTFEYRMRHADGSWRWVLSRDVGMGGGGVDGDAPARYVVGSTTDVTEHNRAERAARRHEAQLSIAAAAAGLGTFEVDLVDGIMQRSALAARISGHPDRLRLTVEEALLEVHPEDRGQARELFDAVEVAPGSGSTTVELRLGGVDDEPTWVAITAQPRASSAAADARVESVIGALVEVTVRRRTEMHRALLADLGSHLAAKVPVGSVAAAAVATLRVHLQAERVTLLQVTADGAVQRVIADSRHREGDLDDSAVRPDLLPVSAVRAAVHTGRPWTDARPDGDPVTPAGPAAGHRGLLLVPSLRDDRPACLLAIRRAQPAAWRPDEIETLVEAATRIDTSLERARAQAALEESESRYRSLMTNIDQGFCVLEMVHDPSGAPVDYRFLEVNPTFEQHTGLHDAVGRTARELVPDLEQVWVDTYATVARTGESLTFQQGSVAMGRAFEVEAVRVGRPDQPRVALLFRDITAQLRSEEDLREALDVKDQFLGMVSHELRTPLTVILGMSRMLAADGVDPSRVREMAGDIADSAEALTELLEAMLLLARLDQHESSQSHEPVLVSRVIADVVKRAAGRDRGHGYVVDIRDRGLVVEAQRTWMERVLENLVGNAAKYSDPGTEITIVLAQASDQARVLVLDRGGGVEPGDLEQVFEPFYRAPATRDRTAGLGLGLPVARRIVTLMGGRIWARGREGDGSEFGFEVPLAAEE